MTVCFYFNRYYLWLVLYVTAQYGAYCRSHEHE